jgi:hypothetical protein
MYFRMGRLGEFPITFLLTEGRLDAYILSVATIAAPTIQPFHSMKTVSSIVIAFENSLLSTKIAIFCGLACLGLFAETIEMWKAIALFF